MESSRIRSSVLVRAISAGIPCRQRTGAWRLEHGEQSVDRILDSFDMCKINFETLWNWNSVQKLLELSSSLKPNQNSGGKLGVDKFLYYLIDLFISSSRSSFCNCIGDSIVFKDVGHMEWDESWVKWITEVAALEAEIGALRLTVRVLIWRIRRVKDGLELSWISDVNFLRND